MTPEQANKIEQIVRKAMQDEFAGRFRGPGQRVRFRVMRAAEATHEIIGTLREDSQ